MREIKLSYSVSLHDIYSWPVSVCLSLFLSLCQFRIALVKDHWSFILTEGLCQAFRSFWLSFIQKITQKVIYMIKNFPGKTDSRIEIIIFFYRLEWENFKK